MSNYCPDCEGTFKWLAGCEHTDGWEMVDDHEDIWINSGN